LSYRIKKLKVFLVQIAFSRRFLKHAQQVFGEMFERI
jgi:hypothetical protein